jgi:hypothetical protein
MAMPLLLSKWAPNFHEDVAWGWTWQESQKVFVEVYSKIQLNRMTVKIPPKNKKSLIYF